MIKWRLSPSLFMIIIVTIMMYSSNDNNHLILAAATSTSINSSDTTFHRHIAIFNSRPDDHCITTLNNGSLLTLDEETHFVMLSKKDQQKYPCLENDPGFMGYELDESVYFLAQNSSNQMEMNPPNWGLTRISQRELPLGKAYFYPTSAGHGVNIYILDTGVDIKQPEIVGRAEHGISTVKKENETSSTDYHGHGTMVSCIAAGTRYGVAKKSRIISVKVLEDNGEGYISSILFGISYAIERMKAENNTIPTVINMSFSTEQSTSLNRAVGALTRRDALTVSAAGNGNYEQDDTGRDACSYSPASATNTITVGAVDSSDTLASFSNTGNCTDIYAPGVNIGTISTSGKPVLASGTSFSAPFVSGAAALLYSQAAGKGIFNKIVPRDIKNRIFNDSTQDILHGIHESNNRLLYSDIGIPPGLAANSGSTRTIMSTNVIFHRYYLLLIILVSILTL